MQIICENSSNNLIAIAVLFEVGIKDNDLFSVMGFGLNNPYFGLKLRNNESININNDEIDIKVNLGKYLNNTKNYVSYTGSLTSPPCTQNVKWFILLDKLQVSQSQIDYFPILFGREDNIRGLQSIQGRQLFSN